MRLHEQIEGIVGKFFCRNFVIYFYFILTALTHTS